MWHSILSHQKVTRVGAKSEKCSCEYSGGIKHTSELNESQQNVLQEVY
jgi:hypothetical protein